MSLNAAKIIFTAAQKTAMTHPLLEKSNLLDILRGGGFGKPGNALPSRLFPIQKRFDASGQGDVFGHGELVRAEFRGESRIRQRGRGGVFADDLSQQFAQLLAPLAEKQFHQPRGQVGGVEVAERFGAEAAET